MLEAKITKTGRGPEIAGTRITVYDVLEYEQTGWHRDMIAAILSLTSQQVEAAIRYIGEHRADVMACYEHNMERIRRGNSPEVQAKHEVAHQRLQAKLRELRGAKDGGRRMRGILADINAGAHSTLGSAPYPSFLGEARRAPREPRVGSAPR